MFIRNAIRLIPLTALAALVIVPVRGEAQDATAVLQTVREAIGTQVPTAVRITAAGSGYADAAGDPATRRHFRIESYTQELDLGASSLSERLVRLEPAAASGKAMSHTDSRAARADSPWPDQHAIWTTPFGFLAGAASRPATLSTERLYGLPYQVVTFTTATGQQVRGYVNEKNVLERTRTEIQDPARGTVQVEAIFYDWKDFSGIRFPSVIIRKENDRVAHILVVSAVEAGGTTTRASRQN